MRAAMLVVGDELLGGVIVDRNVPLVAPALSARGVALQSIEMVGDEIEDIADAARRLSERSDLLIVTGGLGPTEDDRTRDGVAAALGVGVEVNEPIREQLEARMRERDLFHAPAATRQASFPEGATVVANPRGSAPGFRVRLGDCDVWVLPGVPPEVEGMLPAILASLPAESVERGWERIVATAGLGEVRVAARLEERGFAPPPGVSLGFLPSPGGVRMRLSAPGGARVASLSDGEARLREALGDWALPEPTLVRSLVRTLQERGRTVATAESCTGGLIGGRITDVPGSSSVYLGGVVTYSDEAKVKRLGVSPELLREHGAVSDEVARSMAGGAREAFGSAIAVAVTGIAGPDGGTVEKPVGTVHLAVADAEGIVSKRMVFPGTREMIRERTVNKALEMAYRRARE